MAFYQVLEMGVSLVAVSLPSIWLVFSSLAPEAIARSIRNVVSLGSYTRRSSDSNSKRATMRGSPDRSTMDGYNKSRNSSPSFVAAHIAGARISVQADAEAYHELQERAVRVPRGEIHVSRSVEQTSDPRNPEQV